MGREYNLEHLHLGNVITEHYISPKNNPTALNIPEREKRQHVKNLRNKIKALEQEFDKNIKTDSALVTIEGKAGFDLKSKSIADKRAGVELLVAGTKGNNTPYAVVRIPREGLKALGKKIDEYETNLTPKGRPKNNDLIAGIEDLRRALLKELWVGAEDYWPTEDDISLWWELWLIGGSLNREYAKVCLDELVSAAKGVKISLNKNQNLEFAERQVILVKANLKQLNKLILKTDVIAEIHPPSRVMLQYICNEYPDIVKIEHLEKNIVAAYPNAPRVAVIDTGVADQHPLLRKVIATNGLHTIDTRSVSTGDYQGHGTEVMGIAAYGNFTELLMKNEPVIFSHSLESVRFQLGEEGTEELWGDVLVEAVNTVEGSLPNVNRIFNLSVGAQHKQPLNGKPTSWSAAVDMLCYNNQLGRIMTIAAGNVYPIDKIGYPLRNLSSEIDDPAHAINAICVGGYTELVNPMPPLDGYDILAMAGELSPHSRSGPVKYAIKPEVVCEAGNVMCNAPLWEQCYDGLSKLTTNMNFLHRPLTNTSQTSMAAPAAARMLAIIWAKNPGLKASTVRGLLIHSASWTEPMMNQFNNKTDLLRAFGYGVPDLEFACQSANSAVTLLAEDEVKCGYIEELENKKNIVRDMCFYKIPWPKEVLLELGSAKVELRITLSYFAEPNPRQTSSAYEGAGLAWDIQGPTELDEEFFKRINKARREEKETGFKSQIDWFIGPQTRSRGTVQSDRWKCTAAELAGCGNIVVFPRHGWWKDNSAKRPNPIMPFSLIISVITEELDVDLYVPIKNLVSIPVEWQ